MAYITALILTRGFFLYKYFYFSFCTRQSKIKERRLMLLPCVLKKGSSVRSFYQTPLQRPPPPPEKKVRQIKTKHWQTMQILISLLLRSCLLLAYTFFCKSMLAGISSANAECHILCSKTPDHRISSEASKACQKQLSNDYTTFVRLYFSEWIISRTGGQIIV